MSAKAYFAGNRSTLNRKTGCRLRLIRKENFSSGRLAFLFDSAGTGFSYKAGQYAYFTVLSPAFDDPKGNSRPFSIANSPGRNGEVMIVLSENDSGFFRSLNMLMPGDEVLAGEVSGEMSLPADPQIPVVFIAGGTGITPVRCLIENDLENGSEREMILFYSDRSPASSLFDKDFSSWKEKNNSFRYVKIFEEDSAGEETGRFSREILGRHIKDFGKYVFYITGPKDMVTSVSQILKDSGVKEKNMITEKA